MAIAQGIGVGSPASRLTRRDGSGERARAEVVLADLHLDASQALLHHTGDVVPGISELVEAHRVSSLASEVVHDLTFPFDDRPYRLLAGLRRRRDWVTLRPRATEAAIGSLRLAFDLVVADISPELEGQEECGSIDVEERNQLARCAALQAGVVVLAARPTPVGVHALVRLVDDLARLGVEPRRVLPVIVAAPRPGPARMELSRDIAALAVPGAGPPPVQRPSNPVFLPPRRDLDRLVAMAEPLPAAYCEPVAGAVLALLDRLGDPPAPEAVTIRPGSLASRGR